MERHNHQRVTNLNTLRTQGSYITPWTAFEEKRLMNSILADELQRFEAMDLTHKALGRTDVNNNLKIFLDGKYGFGGYADMYEKAEWGEPGTRIEMLIEREIMKQHLGETLNPHYLEQIKRDGKDLVIVEGGAGPDLRTFGAVQETLLSKANELQGVPIKLVVVDISKRMAAITASKIRASDRLNLFQKAGLDVSLAVLNADVFDLIDKMRQESLSYALLPFGVVSFGLGKRNPQKTFENIRRRSMHKGGIITTVYNSEWKYYTTILEQVVQQVNSTGGALDIRTLNPFVIRILNGKMQVGGGLAFDCRTFTHQQLKDDLNSSSYSVDSVHVTPKGWAYWPDEALKANLSEQEILNLPPKDAMDRVKYELLKTIANAGGSLSPELFSQLEEAVPTGNTMSFAPAPYITATARRII